MYIDIDTETCGYCGGCVVVCHDDAIDLAEVQLIRAPIFKLKPVRLAWNGIATASHSPFVISEKNTGSGRRL